MSMGHKDAKESVFFLRVVHIVTEEVDDELLQEKMLSLNSKKLGLE